jgi:hypothetical protein
MTLFGNCVAVCEQNCCPGTRTTRPELTTFSTYRAIHYATIDLIPWCLCYVEMPKRRSQVQGPPAHSSATRQMSGAHCGSVAAPDETLHNTESSESGDAEFPHPTMGEISHVRDL